MRLLFICNQNKNRSKTAEVLFKERFQTKSAGLYSSKKLTATQLKWADVIIVMEDLQRSEIAKRFPSLYLQKRILSFDIPDVYKYDENDLKEMLNMKMGEYEELLA